MKQCIYLLAVCASLISCNSAVKNNNAASLEVAKKYMEAVETNNIALMDSLLADNYMGYGPSINDSTNKADALANWRYNAENIYESIKYTRHQNIAVTTTEADEADAGDWVANWAYLTIKYRGGGNDVNLWVNATYKIENGKIARSRTFYNEADVLRQKGFVFVRADEVE
ncbi:nuclear transport factor 2 family protein [Pollutibacter soli]|uniref:nuclear transport factor 2 family protein n=1 Tax=Pollutibacter soli TaxID=3034157 RepID=UPI00301382FA